MCTKQGASWCDPHRGARFFAHALKGDPPLNILLCTEPHWLSVVLESADRMPQGLLSTPTECNVTLLSIHRHSAKYSPFGSFFPAVALRFLGLFRFLEAF